VALPEWLTGGLIACSFKSPALPTVFNFMDLRRSKMIDEKKVLNELKSLTHLDIDAVHAYTAAIDRIDLADVKEKLTQFRGDHERHISDLSALILLMGEEAPKRTLDFKGFLIEGFTAIRSMIGNESAIRAMKGNEELTNRTYGRALDLELPENVRVVVKRGFDDETRHLEYINQSISLRVWERPKKTAA
jgi:rubrerythrin